MKSQLTIYHMVPKIENIRNECLKNFDEAALQRGDFSREN